MAKARLIETDQFPFEFLSTLAERESWRKEVHRPIYHVHKWWAKRLGSVFRGILLGCAVPEEEDLESAFYRAHAFSGISVLDPFMGSGTTIGEAHKLGMTALGRDINPVAVNAARVGLSPIGGEMLQRGFGELSAGVGSKIRALYATEDSRGRASDALYFFWVMQCQCPSCDRDLDLFSSYVIAANAYPKRRPEVRVLCPACGGIFEARHGDRRVRCQACGHEFDPQRGVIRGPKAFCSSCSQDFAVLDAVAGRRPGFRLYGKLVLTQDGLKQYLPVTRDDLTAYETCRGVLREEERQGTVKLPSLSLSDGYNTRQAMAYGFRAWRDFFNDRQLLALGWLHSAILESEPREVREPLLTLFSGLLEFNNMFASYKGEGTGAVRHMFAHHILKPERTPLEANVWGTPKSSGSFSNLFRGRILRAAQYQMHPTEVKEQWKGGVQSSPPFEGPVKSWPKVPSLAPRSIYLSCGDSADLGLPADTVDLVVTDPPFFDNVHYSELADFFYSWQQIGLGRGGESTRTPGEVQDTSAEEFARKLGVVFAECARVLKTDGLLVFTYHHSREEGWWALARAIRSAKFVVVNCHPVKAEMSVATPKSQAKDPIQLDIVVVCRKGIRVANAPRIREVLESGWGKIRRLEAIGLRLSRNDRKVVLLGQLMAAVGEKDDRRRLAELVEDELEEGYRATDARLREVSQTEMF